MKSTRRTLVTVVLFAIYAALLVALILFKFPFQYQLTADGRSLNLVPFEGSFADPRLGVGEVVENVIVFVPLGLYLSMLRSAWSPWRRLLIVVATSVVFEALQYAFAIGRADITDVLGNSLGGAAGIGLYALAKRALGGRANPILNIVTLILTVIIVAFLVFLRIHSR